MSGYRRSFPEGTSERMCALMNEARNISELIPISFLLMNI